MLDVTHLSCGYGQDVVLDDLSFSLEQGDFLAILGPNGCGKSTLLKTINQLLPQKSGQITLHGQRVDQLKAKALAQQMAYVAQQAEPTQAAVYDTVLLGRNPYIGWHYQAEDLKKCQQAIQQLDLRGCCHRSMADLSGGQVQKVMIARALVQEADLLLLDEPTSNLDVKNQHEIMQILNRLRLDKHFSIMMVVHDLNLAMKYCNRFCFLKDQSILYDGGLGGISEELLEDCFAIPTRLHRIDGELVALVQE